MAPPIGLENATEFLSHRLLSYRIAHVWMKTSLSFHCFFTSVRQSPALIFLEEPKWQQLSDLFVFVLFMALKKGIPLKMCTLSCFL